MMFFKFTAEKNPCESPTLMHDESMSAAAPDGIEAATVTYLTVSIIGFKARHKPVFLEGDSDILWQI